MNRLVLYTVVATFFGGVIFLQASYADVYYHKKVDGKHVYTNLRPSDKGYKKIYTSTSRPRYSSQNYGSKWYSRNYDDLINYYSNVYNLDPELVKAIIKVESNFNSGAVSSKGAIGLMQLMPGTAKDQGVRNPLSPTQNISGGTKYLRKLLDMFNGDLKLALAGYNAGENAVIRYGRSIPPYPETQNYVHKVLYHYSHLKKGDNPPVIKRHVVAKKTDKSNFSYKEELEKVGAKFDPKSKDRPSKSAVEVKSVEYKNVYSGNDHIYSLQIASFSNYETAVENLEQLSEQSEYAYLQEALIPGRGTYYRVKIGRFSNKDSALIFAENFKNNNPGYNSAFVTNY